MIRRVSILSLLIALVVPLRGYCQQASNDSIRKKSSMPMKVRVKYADALFQAGNYYDALKEYNEILNAKPDNHAAVYQMGECYLMARDYVNAEKWYAKIIDADADAAFP